MQILKATPLPAGPTPGIRRFSNITFPITDQTRIVPIVGDPGAILGKNLEVGKFLGGSVDWAQFLSRMPAPLAGDPKNPVPASNLPASSPAGAATAAPAQPFGLKIAGGSWSVLQLSHASTQADIAGKLVSVGVAPASADDWANTFLAVSNNHSVQSIIIGTVAGGLVVFAVEKLRPKTPPATKYAIGTVTALVVAALFSFFIPEQSPLIGKWVLDLTGSRYSGDVPVRAQTLEFSSDASGLLVSDHVILPDGKPRYAKYRLNLDGKDYPAPEAVSALANGADALRSYVKGNTSTTTFLKNGKIIGADELVVSADRKQLTVTTSRYTAQGETKETRFYDRK